MKRPNYYVLVEWDEGTNRWVIQFGDRLRALVAAEMDEMKYNARLHRERRQFKIAVADTAHHRDVEAAVLALQFSLKVQCDQPYVGYGHLEIK